MQPLSIALCVPWLLLILWAITHPPYEGIGTKKDVLVYFGIALCCLLGIWRFCVSYRNFPVVDDSPGMMYIAICLLVSFAECVAVLIMLISEKFWGRLYRAIGITEMW
jgi:hypothetical protein